MLQCWSRFPEIRPTFADVCKIMDEFVDASNDAASPFSGAFIYRVPLGGSNQRMFFFFCCCCLFVNFGKPPCKGALNSSANLTVCGPHTLIDRHMC